MTIDFRSKYDAIMTTIMAAVLSLICGSRVLTRLSCIVVGVPGTGVIHSPFPPGDQSFETPQLRARTNRLRGVLARQGPES